MANTVFTKYFFLDKEVPNNIAFYVQEREHRMESKRRNERSNIVFAFGSSTPRMLDPKDNSSSSYWTARRLFLALHYTHCSFMYK